MKSLSKALLKGVLVSLLLALSGPQEADAQQQPASVEELRDQLARLEEIDRDPGTSAEVRGVNQAFIVARRAELCELLVRRRDALRNYLKAGATVLRHEEVKRVEDSIRGLESELSNITGGARPARPRVVEADYSPPSNTAPRPAAAGTEGGRPFLSGNLLPQTPCPADPNNLITGAVISTGRFTGAGAVESKVELMLRAPLSLTNQPPDVSVINRTLIIPADHFEVRLETGLALTLRSPIMVGTGFHNSPFIEVAGAIPVSAKKFTVKLLNLAYDCPSAASPTLIPEVGGSGDILTNAVLSANDIEALNKANKAAAAKRSGDKNFRMGFAAAKGEGEDAQGAADISINKTFFGGGQQTGTLFDFFDQADVGLQLKKSSAEKADPRHLTLGLNLRKSFLIDSRLTAGDVGSRPADALARRDKSKGLLRVLMIKQGLNLEGEAFDFKTTNFVSDTHFELASIAKKLGSGFYNFNLFAGPELGRNMAKPDAAAVAGATAEQLSKADWIARLKAGGEFTLRLLPSSSGDNWGVELNLGYVNRHLFSTEVFTQETTEDGKTTSKLVTVGKGNKAWRQADLKVFLFGDGAKRYGLKVSYNNGQLPPAFTPTRGFQFGMVIESSDDKQGGESVKSQ